MEFDEYILRLHEVASKRNEVVNSASYWDAVGRILDGAMFRTIILDHHSAFPADENWKRLIHDEGLSDKEFMALLNGIGQQHGPPE